MGAARIVVPDGSPLSILDDSGGAVREQIIFDAVVSMLVIVGACFLPKWLYWIAPHANSVWDALTMQYSRRTALIIIFGGAALLTTIFLLMIYGAKGGG
jgi:hypothetical protein